MSRQSPMYESMRTFMKFCGGDGQCGSESLVAITFELLKHCPPARSAVLQWYSHLFDEYCTEFVGKACNHPIPLDPKSALGRLKKNSREAVMMPAGISRKSSVESRKMSTDTKMAVDEEEDNSNTPASPPPAAPVDDSVLDDDDNDDFSEQLIEQLTTMLMELCCPAGNGHYEPGSIGLWAIELLSSLCTKYADLKAKFTPLAARKNEKLSDVINFWKSCKAMFKLIELIARTLEPPAKNTDLEYVVHKLLERSPNTDWVVAYIITAVPVEKATFSFENCIEYLSKSAASPFSVTCILSHLSEHNPQAIINSSKNNIPFLLQLCANSKPLLDVLALEAAKKINVNTLNELSPTITDDMLSSILFCVMNAPNSFSLLLNGFDLATHSEATPHAKALVLKVLTTIIDHVHAIVYTTSFRDEKLPLLDIMKTNSEQLMSSALTKADSQLRQLQFRLIHLLCIHFGKAYTCEIIHCLLNSLKADQRSLTETTPLPINTVITTFLKSLRLAFGTDLNKFFIAVVEIEQPKNISFWINLLSVLEMDEGSEMSIDIVGEHFIELFQQEYYSKEMLYYILRIISCCIEKFPKQIARPKQALCLTFVRCYIELIQEQERFDEDIEVIMQILTMLQKTMSTLARKQITNQHILCRAFLEAILSWNDTNDSIGNNGLLSNSEIVCLKQENIKFGGLQSAYKFRKMPLINSKQLKSRISKNEMITGITSQLLLDGIKSCVVDMPGFASLLVECITPDVMFNDVPWPDEDFLKVTIERDLHIARIFDSQPILWDFCDLIATAGFLHNCAVLVRALMAVQLTQWASATANKEKLPITQKLIKLATKGGLLPEVPFTELPKLLSQLGSWEIYCVLNDIWRYLKDNSSTLPPATRPTSPPIRPYIERLRIIMAENIPGQPYIDIFKI